MVRLETLAGSPLSALAMLEQDLCLTTQELLWVCESPVLGLSLCRVGIGAWLDLGLCLGMCV